MDFTGARLDSLNYFKYGNVLYLVFPHEIFLFLSWRLNSSKTLSFLLTLEQRIFATLVLAVSAQDIFMQVFRP